MNDEGDRADTEDDAEAPLRVATADEAIDESATAAAPAPGGLVRLAT